MKFNIPLPFKKLKLAANVDLLKTQLDQLIDSVENKII